MPPALSHAVETCHLLRLPGELRNRIYEYAYPPTIRLRNLCLATSYNGRRRRAEPQIPGLANTCKQIRHELLSICHGKQQFKFCECTIRLKELELFACRARSWLPYVRSIEQNVAIRVIGSTLQASAIIFVKVSETGMLVVTCERPARWGALPFRWRTCVLKRQVESVNAGTLASLAAQMPPMTRFMKLVARDAQSRDGGVEMQVCASCKKLAGVMTMV